MKNKIYYLGLAALMLVSTGCMFKIMHWPGAGIMFTLGILMLCFAFVPFAFISSFRTEENKSWKNLYIITAIVLIIIMTGALFKVMHWPGAGTLILICIPLPFILILPAYTLSRRKENEINYRNFLAIIFFFAYFAAITALMALGVSKNVIDGYIRSAINIDQKTEAVASYYLTWQEKINDTNKIGKEKSTMLQQVMKQSDVICNEIDSVVINMILLQNKNGTLIKKDGKPDLWKIKFKDAAVDDRIIDDLSKLKLKLIDYRKVLAESNGKKNIASQFSLPLKTNNDNKNWEYGMIFNKILVSGIEQLYLLKHQVRMAEWKVLSLIY